MWLKKKCNILKAVFIKFHNNLQHSTQKGIPWTDFQKNILIFKDWTFKKIFWKDMISRLLGRENEKWLGLGIVVAGLPPLSERRPPPPQRHLASWAYPSVNTQQSSIVSSPWREKETSLFNPLCRKFIFKDTINPPPLLSRVI